MKLREIIERVDRSYFNENEPSYSELASNEFGLNGYDVTQDWDKGRLKTYSYAKWLCTDTHVGGLIYFLDDECVAVSWQNARKSDEDIDWISKEAYIKVRDYLISLMVQEDESDKKIYLDLDVEQGDGFQVSYGSQLLTKNMILKSTNEKVTVIKKFDGYDKINSWQTVEVEFEDGRKELINLSELLIPYNVK